jgi:hypothetical protein
MEAVGLAVSVASLVSLFDTAVGAFRCVQVSKTFGTDAQSACLQLDSAQLRLTRWGQSIGIGSDFESARSLKVVQLTEHDVQHAENLLGQIVLLLQKAEKESARLRATQSSLLNPVDSDLSLSLSSETLTLHARVLEICRRRQHNASLVDKAKWAICGKENFQTLVDSISRHTSDLLELFPSARTTQRQLCVQEAEEMQGLLLWPQFLETAKETDQILANAVDQISTKVSSINAVMVNLALTTLGDEQS